MNVPLPTHARRRLINTGTEILLGDVINTHLSFIAREILPLGLRVERQIVGPGWECYSRCIAGELLARGSDFRHWRSRSRPTDDLTREITAELIGLDLESDLRWPASITQRLTTRGIRLTDRILRQAQVPRGALVLPNDNGSAPGLYSRGRLEPGGRVAPPVSSSWTTA